MAAATIIAAAAIITQVCDEDIVAFSDDVDVEVWVGVAVGVDASGLMLGVGAVKGVGLAVTVAVGAVVGVGVGVAVCLAMNHVQIEGLNSVVWVVVGAAYLASIMAWLMFS
jgi:predicted membrane-bound spermidine synthase